MTKKEKSAKGDSLKADLNRLSKRKNISNSLIIKSLVKRLILLLYNYGYISLETATWLFKPFNVGGALCGI